MRRGRKRSYKKKQRDEPVGMEPLGYGSLNDRGSSLKKKRKKRGHKDDRRAQKNKHAIKNQSLAPFFFFFVGENPQRSVHAHARAAAGAAIGVAGQDLGRAAPHGSHLRRCAHHCRAVVVVLPVARKKEKGHYFADGRKRKRAAHVGLVGRHALLRAIGQQTDDVHLKTGEGHGAPVVLGHKVCRQRNRRLRRPEH